MKRCSKCKKEKALNNFTTDKKAKDGRNSWCKECTSTFYRNRRKTEPERFRDYQEKYRKNHAKRWIKLRRKYAKQSRERLMWLNGYKLQQGCAICGYNDFAEALNFHHVTKTNKNRNVPSLISLKKEKIKKELEKCCVLCANCHRLIHAGLVALPLDELKESQNDNRSNYFHSDSHSAFNRNVVG